MPVHPLTLRSGLAVLLIGFLSSCIHVRGDWEGTCNVEDTDGNDMTILLDFDIDQDYHGELVGTGWFVFEFDGDTVEVDGALDGERETADVTMSLDGFYDGYLWKLDFDGGLDGWSELDGDCSLGTLVGSFKVER